MTDPVIHMRRPAASSRRPRRPRRLLVVMLALLAMALGGGFAAAEEIDLRYDVGIAGMRIFRVGYQGALRAKSYRASARFRPAGLGGLFFSSSMDMRASGRLGSPRAHPVTFAITTKKKGREKNATVNWRDGRVTDWRRRPPHAPERARAVSAAIAGRAVRDPLAMLVEEGLKGPSGFCRGSRRIFDGLRVYDLRFTRLGTRRDGRYGELHLCRMVYVPVAGMSAKKKRKALKKPPVFEVAFAEVRDRDVGTVLVPVSATGRLKGRPFSARLARARIGGRPLGERIVRRR